VAKISTRFWLPLPALSCEEAHALSGGVVKEGSKTNNAQNPIFEPRLPISKGYLY
jgi:hypothetical protein